MLHLYFSWYIIVVVVIIYILFGVCCSRSDIIYIFIYKYAFDVFIVAQHWASERVSERAERQNAKRTNLRTYERASERVKWIDGHMYSSLIVSLLLVYLSLVHPLVLLLLYMWMWVCWESECAIKKRIYTNNKEKRRKTKNKKKKYWEKYHIEISKEVNWESYRYRCAIESITDVRALSHWQ